MLYSPFTEFMASASYLPCRSLQLYTTYKQAPELSKRLTCPFSGGNQSYSILHSDTEAFLNGYYTVSWFWELLRALKHCVLTTVSLLFCAFSSALSANPAQTVIWWECFQFFLFLAHLHNCGNDPPISQLKCTQFRLFIFPCLMKRLLCNNK